jgi:hypothetical protein
MREDPLPHQAGDSAQQDAGGDEKGVSSAAVALLH